MRVLLVEDDAALNCVVREVLSQAGHWAVGVTSVGEACIALEAQCFDVVVLDWLLVGETSEELLPRIAALPNITAAVMYSADSRARAVALSGSIPFLGKPFDIDALLGLIDSAVRKVSL